MLIPGQYRRALRDDCYEFLLDRSLVREAGTNLQTLGVLKIVANANGS